MNSTKYNEEFIKKLIRQKEGKLLDFKQKITSKEKIAKTISAFSNSEGGFLLIGISDKKQVVGIDPFEEQFMIESANEEYCNSQATLTFHPIKWTEHESESEKGGEELMLLLVKVSPSQGPLIYCKNKSGNKKAYKRTGDQTLLISDQD
jgi:predicted HTH transcriptional regulator